MSSVFIFTKRKNCNTRTVSWGFRIPFRSSSELSSDRITNLFRRSSSTFSSMTLGRNGTSLTVSGLYCFPLEWFLDGTPWSNTFLVIRKTCYFHMHVSTLVASSTAGLRGGGFIIDIDIKRTWTKRWTAKQQWRGDRSEYPANQIDGWMQLF